MFHRIFADNTNKKSVSSRLRQKRFQLFMDLLNQMPPIINVLDVGGTQEYWEKMAIDPSLLKRVQVTFINIYELEITSPNFKAIVGDARKMPLFANQQFDIVFSNSTIEHVGDYSDQKRMAEEIIRVGKYYCIQTPNRHFPIEPHFVFPFFQFLPIHLRAWLVQHFKLGWIPKIPDRQKALLKVKSIRLITKPEMKTLFPGAEIFEEKYFGLTKSFTACTYKE